MTHGLRNHKLYKTWQSMLARCNNKNNRQYKDYGGRGITVCNEWLDINNFINDMFPSFIEGLTLDRENHLGNYEKSNCRWTTYTVQNRNTRVLQTNNNSGYRGVTYYKQSKKWVAQIRVNYKKIYLGIFDTAIEAGLKYDNFVIENKLEHTKNFSYN